ncbi:MAG: hypothetical protein V7K83_17865 [Nostoc sp.]
MNSLRSKFQGRVGVAQPRSYPEPAPYPSLREAAPTGSKLRGASRREGHRTLEDVAFTTY